MRRSAFWLYSFLVVVVASALASADDAEAIKKRLLAQPPPVLAAAALKNPDRMIQVDFLRANLDGSGKFQFIVAFYSQELNGWGVYLRVFKDQGPVLELIGEQEDQNPHGGYGVTPTFVDIDGDGIPELDLSGTDSSGSQVMHEYFRWTGTSMHELLDPAKEMANDGSLENIDGDGSLELVVRHGANRYIAYKFDGANFTLFKTFDHDPGGVVGPDGKVNIVRAHFSALKPHVFSIDEIMAAVSKDSDDAGRGSERDSVRKIQVILGNLQDMKAKSVPVEEIDATTLILVRNLHPLSFRIRPLHEHDRDDDADDRKRNLHSVLELEFAQRDILRLLPGLKLTAPLASRDKLQMRLFGKLRNGTRVSATTSVVIRGDREDRDRGN